MNTAAVYWSSRASQGTQLASASHDNRCTRRRITTNSDEHSTSRGRRHSSSHGPNPPFCSRSTAHDTGALRQQAGRSRAQSLDQWTRQAARVLSGRYYPTEATARGHCYIVQQSGARRCDGRPVTGPRGIRGLFPLASYSSSDLQHRSCKSQSAICAVVAAVYLRGGK
ncbi:hypothetical protein K523DRAFT_53935 [Schizophyllum commune Tattone D]|nr:hypothetical protein K523DRAFT_53935 [Schizophyllum commune Tattone D]